MSKRAWYLIGMVLLAGACSPVLEPKAEAFVPSNAEVGQPAPASRALGGPKHTSSRWARCDASVTGARIRAATGCG